MKNTITQNIEQINLLDVDTAVNEYEERTNHSIKVFEQYKKDGDFVLPAYYDLRNFHQYWGDKLDLPEREVQLLKIKKKHGLTDREFERLEKAVNMDFAPQRLKWDIQLYLQETDPAKSIISKKRLQQIYSLSRFEFDQLCGKYDSSVAATKAKRYTPGEFAQLETEGLQWLYPALVPARGITILSSDPGVGKTTLAYDLAASVIYGDDFLGEPASKRGKVLFISADELPCFAQDKLITRGFDFTNNQWTFMTDWDISQKAELEKALEDEHPALVIIDSFAAIHRDSGFDENSAQAKHSIQWLERTMNKYQTTGLLIHHNNKNPQSGVSKLRGSSAIAAAASAVILLEKDDKGKITISTPKIRGAEPVKLFARYKGENGRFELIDQQQDDGTKSLAEAVLKLFHTKYKTERLEFEVIYNELGSSNKQSVYKALDRLIKRGQLVKRPSMRDPRSRVWGLPKTSQSVTELSQEVSLPPPPPHTRSKMSNIISETNTTQGIEDSRQILDTYSTPSEKTIKNEQCLISSNPHPVTIADITLDSPQKQREGGVTVDSLTFTKSNNSPLETVPEAFKKGQRYYFYRMVNGQHSRWWGKEVEVTQDGLNQWSEVEIVVLEDSKSLRVEPSELKPITIPQQLDLFET